MATRSLPPGLNVQSDEAAIMTDILNQARDSMQRLVQLLQSNLADDKDTMFEYQDAKGQVQVRMKLLFTTDLFLLL